VSKPRRIDTHAHIVPPAYRAWLIEKGLDAGGLPIPAWSVEAALENMDANAIETAILSVSTPGVEPGQLQEARAMAREVNEFAAKVVADRPGRFGFFATLTLPDIDGAIAEARYALDTLHADGVVLHAHAHNTYLGDPSFDPLMDELNDHKAVIFVHPSELVGNSVTGIPAFVADFLLDSVRAAINLSRTGTMDRCPDIKVLLSHAGGFLPYAAERIAPFASPKGSAKDGLRLLQRFYLDTAVASSRFSLPSLLAFAQPGHVTYGSDFPYAPAVAARRYTSELDAFHSADHPAINRGNAEVLFPRLAVA
jgi:predicted TIM-barrel fold metal-dependent hydrolase